MVISTHTLTWSVTCNSWICVAYHAFQLTRSRGAWLRLTLKPHHFMTISTHTLTWSVTWQCKRTYIIWKISTHTLTWSVTLLPLPLCLSFQISTHTLTWSVTVDSLTALYTKIISTHTLTWSVTYMANHTSTSMTFQLTRSRGAWPLKKISDLLILDFNSHAHVERDW